MVYVATTVCSALYLVATVFSALKYVVCVVTTVFSTLKCVLCVLTTVFSTLNWVVCVVLLCFHRIINFMLHNIQRLTAVVKSAWH